MIMHKGTLISFEGGEGAGKTVQIKRLKDWLYSKGYDVVVLREPGGTVISEKIREILLDPDNIGMAYTTEVLLFQAARAQIYREIIVPSLNSRKIVLMDRTSDSSVVYQGMVRGFGVEMITSLNQISTDGMLPDLTFYLDVPVEVGLTRRAESGKLDRLDMEGTQFHLAVREAYLKLVEEDTTGRLIYIDADRDIEAVSDDVIGYVQTTLSKLEK